MCSTVKKALPIPGFEERIINRCWVIVLHFGTLFRLCKRFYDVQGRVLIITAYEKYIGIVW